MKAILFEPIGFVRRSTGTTDQEIMCQEECEIVLDPRFAAGLDGLDEFSHIYVLWNFHLNAEKKLKLRVHPTGRHDLPEVGVFATCSPVRPNLLALTRVELLSIEDNVLKVFGLDAFDGSPVLDIKPFIGVRDKELEFRFPDWLHRLLDGT